MKLKAIRHSTANTAEFRAGAPGDWLRSEELVPDNYVLSPFEISNGFELLTEAQWQTLRAAVKPQWDAWVASREESERTASRETAQQQLDIMQAIAGSSGTLTAAQLSNAARATASLLLKVGAWIKDQR